MLVKSVKDLKYFVFHRLTEWLRLEQTSGIFWSNLPAQAGLSKAGCPELLLLEIIIDSSNASNEKQLY